MKYAVIFVVGLLLGWAASFFSHREYPKYPPIGADKTYIDMAIKEIKAGPGNHDQFLKDYDPDVVIGQKLVCVIFSHNRETISTDANSKAYCFDKFKNNYVGSF